jgi:hypothetical protein
MTRAFALLLTLAICSPAFAALDTKAQRGSVIGMASPARQWLAEPGSADTESSRLSNVGLAATGDGINYVIHTTAGSSGGNGVTTTAIDTTGADLIVVSGAFFGTPTLTDSEGNTWTALTVQNGSAGEQSQLFYCANPTTDAAHTFTLTGASTFPTIGVVAVSGAASSPFDDENGLSIGTSDTSIQPGSITPSEDGCLVVTSLTTAGGANHTINGTYTASVVDNLASNHYGGGIGWNIQSTAAATNPTWSWTNSVGRTSAIASFLPDTGESGSVVPIILQLH